MLDTIIKNSIATITVLWSESSYINDQLGTDEHLNINKTITLATFTALCLEAKNQRNDNTGYHKTKFVVNFNDGTTKTLRIDINNDEYDPVQMIKEMIEYSIKGGQ